MTVSLVNYTKFDFRVIIYECRGSTRLPIAFKLCLVHLMLSAKIKPTIGLGTDKLMEGS